MARFDLSDAEWDLIQALLPRATALNLLVKGPTVYVAASAS